MLSQRLRVSALEIMKLIHVTDFCLEQYVGGFSFFCAFPLCSSFIKGD